jgi:chemotaxis protein MotB
MRAGRFVAALTAAMLAAASGCVVPRAQLDEALVRSRTLAEQNRAQLAEIENLRIHSRNIENQLMRTEQDLALLAERSGLDREQLANYRREHSELAEQVRGIGGPRAVSPSVVRQLGELSRQFPNLRCDPTSGVARLDSDILFESGEAELKPGAEQLVRQLVEKLKAPELGDLRVVVVGHTDDRQVAGRPVRERYPDNFHLSAARALGVTDLMRRSGLPEERIGIAAMGAHEPITPNFSEKDRQKNRRVEVFVMAPEVPVVGWTDTMPALY